jgi:WhiB family redox-sensing transcriptional regulator
MKSSIVQLSIRMAPPPSPPPTIGARLPCQRENPALWFSSLPAELNLAKAFCRTCRNLHPCLEGAVERAEPVGVWGGEIFEKGRIIENKRPRGRPRKATLEAAAS